MEILGSIKTYDWGTVGNQSKVAQLALKNDENFAKEFNETTPYAELWYVLGLFVLNHVIRKKKLLPIFFSVDLI